jgi:PPOX class probable F420-dependent enzyme
VATMPSPEKMAHADERLRREIVIWLTTVRGDGRPQSSPVWFLWDGRTFLIFSLPRSQKLPNIRNHPEVALHLNDVEGSDIVSIEGLASIAEDEPPPLGVPEYIEKYREGIADLGWTVQKFSDDYSAPIRVTPTRWRIPY